MKKKVIDLTGQRFGSLTVIEYGGIDSTNGYAKWLCKCDCGNRKTILSRNLRSGATKSCGCLRKKTTSATMKTHGMADSRLYGVWLSMRRRCDNPKTESYRNYGERGISVCNEWEHFEPFMEWAIKNGYHEGLSIDRIDVDGNYGPDNCRWVTMKEQQNNRRNNHIVDYNGDKMTLAMFARSIGIDARRANYLLKRGYTTEQIKERI